ncbi:MAG: two-component sensor histidine kinase [Desulfomicrobiaceae bacterium]|jgi:signal transduction histidine kinase|nr:two-component sensor histidine kinase [Desulfomicrobiaceae bacterium]
MSLKQRFLIVLSLSMGVLGVFFAVLLSINLRDQLVTDTEHKASLILSQAEAIQAYVAKVLRPTMYARLHSDAFILEAMSTSYVTRKIMSSLGLHDEQVRYRRVAVGARNPDYEADSFERATMERFAADPTLTRIEEITQYNGDEVFLAARPVRLQPSCLRCHGRPADAPKTLLERYGNERGFWRHPGELVGLDMVVVPVGSALGQIKGKTVGFLSLFAVGLAGFYLTMQVFFDRLVVANLRRVTDVLRHYFPQEAGATPSSTESPATHDEIEEIYTGIETLAARLKEARENIEQYARNLEGMVAARTRGLTHEAQERRADVALFVDLLHTIGNAHTNTELLTPVLGQLGKRFGADWAYYQCGSGIGSVLWPHGAAVPAPPDNWRDIIASGEMVLTDCEVLVPVRTTDISRGILRLHFSPQGPSPTSHAPELYQAIGHQLALALENLDAINSLMAQNALLASIFDGISDPLALVDNHRTILLANEPARALALALGGPAPASEPLKLPPRFFGDHPFDPNEEGAPTAPILSSIILEDGRSFEVARYPLHSPPDHPRRFVVYARENTAERRMLERLRQTEKLVAVGKLAAGLAHEVNNPLGVILCYTELLRQSITDPQCREDLAVIERHAVNAKKVLRDLLDFARPRPAQTGPCDISALLTGLARIFEVQAQARRCTLRLELPPDPLFARADASALEQVVSNLLLNALDAVEPHAGTVTLRAACSEDGRHAVITVADDGPGIPESDLPHIFDPFFTTKEVGRGTGLGLAVAFGLMHDMGGTIEALNQGGALFVLTLPREACPKDDQ